MDGCFDSDGKTLKPYAGRIVERFDTYTERSQSDRGIHLVFKDSSERIYTSEEYSFAKGVYESYPSGSTNKYCALTGWRLEGTPNEIADKPTEPFNIPEELKKNALFCVHRRSEKAPANCYSLYYTARVGG